LREGGEVGFEMEKTKQKRDEEKTPVEKEEEKRTVEKRS